MVKKTIAFFTIVFLSLLPLTYAWTEVEQVGEWNIATVTEWETDYGCGERKLRFNKTVQNFSSWVSEYEMFQADDDSFILTDHTIYLYIQGNNSKTYGIDCKLAKSTGVNFFGFTWSTTWTAIEYYENGSWTAGGSVGSLWCNPLFRIYRNSSTTLIISGEYYHNNKCVGNLEKVFTVESSFWSEVTLTILYYKDSARSLKYLGNCGMKADGIQKSETIQTDIGDVSFELNETVEFGQTIVDIIWSSLQQAYSGFTDAINSNPWLNTIYSYLAWGWSLMLLAFSYGEALLSILPYILIVYILDVGLTSIYTGSFSPIGKFVTTMYNLIANIVSSIISGLHTIWDVITFWS